MRGDMSLKQIVYHGKNLFLWYLAAFALVALVCHVFCNSEDRPQNNFFALTVLVFGISIVYVLEFTIRDKLDNQQSYYTLYRKRGLSPLDPHLRVVISAKALILLLLITQYLTIVVSTTLAVFVLCL
jgi:hypothetical protein